MRLNRNVHTRTETCARVALRNALADVHDDREDAFIKSLSRTVGAHRMLKKNPDILSAHTDMYIGGGGAGVYVGGASQSASTAVGNHYGIFVGALLARASDEQLAAWFQKAVNMKILGAYAQTELGHVCWRS